MRSPQAVAQADARQDSTKSAIIHRAAECPSN